MLEENFRRALIISGELVGVPERPICAGFLALSCLFLVAVLLPGIRKGRARRSR